LVNRTEGVITFSFEVFDVGENVFPTAKSDTVKVLDDQASVTQEAANTTFENEFDETATTGIGDMIDQYLDDLDEFTRGLPSLPDDLREWTDRLMRAKDSIGKLLAYPGDLAREMMGILEDIKSVVTDPIRALEVYDNVKNRWDGMRAELAVTGGLNRNVASKNGVASSVPTVTNQAEKNAILANAAAYQKLIINSATISKASALGSADTTYSFGDEAEVVASLSGAERNVIMTGQQLKAIGYKLAAELAELAETEVENGNSALWRQMRSLRQAVLADTKERAELLPQLTVFTPTVTVPVSLIAWQQTGDTERRNSIVRRNGIRNPAFVTPNDSVEVING
ncbi:multidrug DMT transporter permease, partial [Vibrio cholerae]